jgi:hypothetical protein
MITKTLQIIKKNRVYFACKDGKYDCKIRITEASKNLELGKQTLLLRDCSVFSKYGVDYIYELEAAKCLDKIVTLKHMSYNKELVKKCKEFGGKWDSEYRTWIFSSFVEDKVKELDYIYNSEIVDVEITALESLSTNQCSIEFFGYVICTFSGIVDEFKLSTDVAMISGNISNAVEIKNLGIKISEGSKFRLKVPKKLLEGFSSEIWKLEILDKEKDD